jgi:hypothetical protein
MARRNNSNQGRLTKNYVFDALHAERREGRKEGTSSGRVGKEGWKVRRIEINLILFFFFFLTK